MSYYSRDNDVHETNKKGELGPPISTSNCPSNSSRIEVRYTKDQKARAKIRWPTTTQHRNGLVQRSDGKTVIDSDAEHKPKERANEADPYNAATYFGKEVRATNHQRQHRTTVQQK